MNVFDFWKDMIDLKYKPGPATLLADPDISKTETKHLERKNLKKENGRNLESELLKEIEEFLQTILK